MFWSERRQSCSFQKRFCSWNKNRPVKDKQTFHLTLNHVPTCVMHRYLRLFACVCVCVCKREPSVTVIDPNIFLRSLALASAESISLIKTHELKITQYELQMQSDCQTPHTHTHIQAHTRTHTPHLWSARWWCITDKPHRQTLEMMTFRQTLRFCLISSQFQNVAFWLSD